MNCNAVVRLGNMHAVVPKHTLPLEWSVVTISAGDMQDFLSKRSGGKDTESENVAFRSTLPEKSAVLIVLANECLGVRAGDATFPFRSPVICDSLRPSILAQVQVFNLDIFICADLLSLAVLLGHPGQADVTSQWHRLSARMFKEIATLPRDESAPPALVMRIPESEAEDLRAYQAQTTKNQVPVHGVSKRPLFPFNDYMLIISPALHVFLGLVNFVNQLMYKVTDESCSFCKITLMCDV